ncbi:hypothetical protein ABL840_08945 [Variovorax sp. NFACC27]|uniref:hypothetical protein n=1 Tax=unclassified Variovorax TaxID=663243 RepID=UPI00089B6592|nr:hypothetical protein SAMN03159371_05302 [Variovorax sp. NFACC28]SEG89544.1 hypothetical protein SAMN03159365_05145 [Variovorax sp. NFACC29]SFD40940.1 hypothetical protein SAMN03159379_05192 [Variovorax sp. NFACC26]SFG43049.1 hypothetical protein SAMN03159447_03302 [Variovorax sp. NFACC27]
MSNDSAFLTTVSKVVSQSHTQGERALLQKWCDEAAKAGGTFSITALYDEKYGHCITYEINWPKSTGDVVRAAAAISTGREG